MMVTISDITICEQTIDLDSHLDQSVVGSNSIIVQDYDKPVFVVLILMAQLVRL